MSNFTQQEADALRLSQKLSDHADVVRSQVSAKVNQMNAELEAIWHGAAGSEFREGANQMVAVVNGVCARTQDLAGQVKTVTHQVTAADGEQSSSLRQHVQAGLSAI